MMLPYARLKMLVIANWSVKPTAPSAMIDAVTSPNPIASVTWFTPGSRALRS